MKVPKKSMLKLYSAMGTRELNSLLIGDKTHLTSSEFAKLVILLLKYNPGGWELDGDHVLVYGGLKIYVGVAPVYIYNGGPKYEDALGYWWQRWRIRKLAKKLKLRAKPKKKMIPLAPFFETPKPS